MSDCAEGANDHPVNHSAKKKKKKVWGGGQRYAALLLYNDLAIISFCVWGCF